MDRLTKRTINGKIAYAPLNNGECVDVIDLLNIWGEKLADYEDTGLEPEEITTLQSYVLLDKYERGKLFEYQSLGYTIGHLRELVQAEKEGRLEVLPCKVGDTVYEPNKRGFISTYKVISIHISACSILVGWELVDGIYSNVRGFEVSALGKTVFLTREEAEAALKGGEV